MMMRNKVSHGLSTRLLLCTSSGKDEVISMRIKQGTNLAQENFPGGSNAGVNVPGKLYRWIFSGVRQFFRGQCSMKTFAALTTLPEPMIKV